MTADGTIRGVVINITEIVKYMVSAHKLDTLAAKALGEAAVGGMLLASAGKPGERINLNIQGNARVKQALVDSTPEGAIRGYVILRSDSGPVPDFGLVQGPWGEGVLSVLRSKDLERQQPYIGTVPLMTGHLAKDLTFYWAQSEQVPSACGISVRVSEEGEVMVAGGFLIQAMPGAQPKDIKKVEARVQSLVGLDDKLAVGASPVALLAELFDGSPFVILEERPLRFECSCSAERVERALVLVGEQELQSMHDADHGAVIRCDFCASEYRMDEAQLDRLIARSRGDSI